MEFVTEIRAEDSTTGELTTFAGPNVIAYSFEEAKEKVKSYGMPWVKVIGFKQHDSPEQIVNNTIC